MGFYYSETASIVSEDGSPNISRLIKCSTLPSCSSESSRSITKRTNSSTFGLSFSKVTTSGSVEGQSRNSTSGSAAKTFANALITNGFGGCSLPREAATKVSRRDTDHSSRLPKSQILSLSKLPDCFSKLAHPTNPCCLLCNTKQFWHQPSTVAWVAIEKLATGV